MRATAVVISIVAVGSLARAQPKRAPSPCVVKDEVRTVRDVAVHGDKLTFCTGDDCWALDASTNTFSNIPTIKPGNSVTESLMQFGRDFPSDPRVKFGKNRVAFCVGEAKSCKQFTFKLDFAPDNLVGVINHEGTLGAVIASGAIGEGGPSWVYAYDLVKDKLIKRVEGWTAHAFKASLLIDDTVYSAKMKKLGAIGITGGDISTISALLDDDHVAFANGTMPGKVVIGDATNGKASAPIDLGFTATRNLTGLIAANGGARLFVLTDLGGEILTIDVAARKVIARASPPACPAGTTR